MYVCVPFFSSPSPLQVECGVGGCRRSLSSSVCWWQEDGTVQWYHQLLWQRKGQLTVVLSMWLSRDLVYTPTHPLTFSLSFSFQLWECGIEQCKEIASQLELLFDYEKLSQIHVCSSHMKLGIFPYLFLLHPSFLPSPHLQQQTISRFYSSILRDVRAEPMYFRVGFYGGFPPFLKVRYYRITILLWQTCVDMCTVVLHPFTHIIVHVCSYLSCWYFLSPPVHEPKNKAFIFRGHEFEKLSDFNARLSVTHPQAKVCLCCVCLCVCIPLTLNIIMWIPLLDYMCHVYNCCCCCFAATEDTGTSRTGHHGVRWTVYPSLSIPYSPVPAVAIYSTHVPVVCPHCCSTQFHCSCAYKCLLDWCTCSQIFSAAQ